ncbi:PEP-CTERM sorting domain-containing protein [Massilia aurea]|uniref:PEP-CTERM sorting domain-containing protein n=1 Tax=Massilia aurea TaxID=373040 RepID=UPI003461A8ED
MKKLITTALLTALCTISTAALATPVAMTGSFASGSLSDNTYSAVFSGKSLLPTDYTVNSLSYSFTFRDDDADNWTTSAPVSNGNSGLSAYMPHTQVSDARYITYYQTVQRSSEQESAALSIGGVLLGTGATAMKESSVTTEGDIKPTIDRQDCVWLYCYYTYYTKARTDTTTVTRDYTGAFTISGIISNQSIIDELLRSDQLTLNLKVAGDLVLTNSQLLLDYTKVIPAAEVPEPSSILLALAGLAGLGAVRRRSKKPTA